jgi:hypothetical protein
MQFLTSSSSQINAIEILFKEDQRISGKFQNHNKSVNAVELSQFCRRDRCVGASPVPTAQ